MNTVPQTDLKSAIKATKSIFLICGFGISSWAVMVPFTKERLHLNDANLGLLMLLLGAGAISMMPVTGTLIKKFGSRIIILVSSVMLAVTLPLLLLMKTTFLMGLLLFLFGGAVGIVDVAMNAHGVQVQNLYKKPIMSSLHGLFSVGGLFGSLGLGLLIKFGLSPLGAALSISVILLIIVGSQYRLLLNKQEELKGSGPVEGGEHNKPTASSHSWFQKSILYFGFLCFSLFLAEGAMLDWSAVFLRESRGVGAAMAGVGYAAFSIAMAVMRLLGDKIILRFDSKKVVVYGSFIAATGLFITLLTPWVAGALLGFILLGIGCANLVPVFLSEGGRIKSVPASVALPAIITFGYAGQLAGPAILGFIAHQTSLSIALGCNAILLLFVTISFGFRKQFNNQSVQNA